MKLHIILLLLVVLAPVPLSAQFIGDTLAAAGFNISEDQAMAGLSAIVAARTARTAAPSPAPAAQPQVTTRSSEPAPIAPLPPMGPGGVSFSGGGRVTTVEDVEEYKAAFLPVGKKVSSPPAGAESIKTASGTFAYFRGVFYAQAGAGWVVVPAPVGAVVKGRPAGVSMIVHFGKPYLYYNGAFFVWNGSADTSTVVTPPAGIVVTYIPETATKKDHDGQSCFEYGATCFKPKYRGTRLVYEVS